MENLFCLKTETESFEKYFCTSKGTIDRQSSCNESLFKHLKYSYHYLDKEQLLGFSRCFIIFLYYSRAE